MKSIRDKDICNNCKLQGKCSVSMEGDFWIGECNYFEDKNMEQEDVLHTTQKTG
jgi:hypothetical protein